MIPLHPRLGTRAAVVGALVGFALAWNAAPGSAALRTNNLLVTPTLSINDVSADEGNSGLTTFTFTVTVTNPSSDPIMVDFETDDWTADSSDYLDTSGTLTIPANTASGTIEVKVIGDVINEEDEYFIVTLSNPVNATISNPYGIGTIVNDDDYVSPSVTVISPNGGETLTTGDVAKLSWSADDNVGVTHVDLLMSFNGGATYKILRKNYPNSGTYAWHVHGPPTTNALFKVVAYDEALNHNSDVSDAVFEIITGPTDVEIDQIADFELSRVSPNPTTGPAAIEYALPREAKVRLTVLDIQGRIVSVLADEVKAPGRYRAVWGRNTTSGVRRAGVYFVRFEVPGRNFVRRITVLE